MLIELLKTVKAGGVYYSPGSALETSDEEAKRLVKLKVAQFPRTDEPEPESEPEPVQEPEPEGSESEPEGSEPEPEGSEPETAIEELQQVKGVTKAIATQLVAGGISDIESLQNCSVEDLMELNLRGVGEKKAEAILRDANEFTFEEEE